jgi:hypothetical protein
MIDSHFITFFIVYLQENSSAFIPEYLFKEIGPPGCRVLTYLTLFLSTM